MLRLLFLVIAAVVIADSLSNPGNSVNGQSDQDQVLIQKIASGDVAAISEVGKSGRAIFIPYLRRELHDQIHKETNVSAAQAAKLALSQLGDQEQLQECWCQLISEDPEEGIAPPLEELLNIRGWFSIQVLQKFLVPEGLIHWQKALSRNAAKHPLDQDVMVSETPTTEALRILPRLVDNPPVQFSRESSADGWKKQTKVWQDWIAAHKEELSKLEPTGEGVDFSDKACKNGKPRKKH